MVACYICFLKKKNINSLNNSVPAMVLAKHIGNIGEPNLQIYL